MKGAHREERTQTQIDRQRSLPNVAQHDGVLPAYETEGLLENAGLEVPGPARQRILIEPRQMLETARGGHVGKLMGVEIVAPVSRFDRCIDMRENDVSFARRVERGDEEPVVAARVQLGDGRARVSS